MAFSSEPAPEWIPQPTQREFLDIPLSIYEGGIGGAVGGGKTDALIRYPVYRGLVAYPLFKCLLIRKTERDLEREILFRARDWWERPPYFARWNQSRLNHTFPSGAVIQYGSGVTKEDMKKFDGTEYQMLLVDEAGHFEWEALAYLSLRIRSSKKKMLLPDGRPFPTAMRFSIMPGGPGQVWFPERYHEGIPGGKEGRVLIRQKFELPDGTKGEMKRIFIPSKIQDMQGVIDSSYMQNFWNLPEHERKALLYGDWDAYHGQVFTSLRVTRRAGEPENALHVIDPIEIPSWWTRWIAIDPGYAANCCMLWYALDPETYQMHLYRVYNHKHLLVSQWASDCARLSDGERISLVGMDGNAWNKGGLPDTVVSEFVRHSGMRPIPVQNKLKDRIAGKLAIQEALRWEPKPKSQIGREDEYDGQYAWHLYKVKGLKNARRYRQGYLPEPDESGRPLLLIHRFSPEGSSNEDLWKCLQTRVPDEKRPEDVKQTRNDDCYDAARYGKGLYWRILAGDSGTLPHSKVLEWWSRKRLTSDELTSYNVMRQILPRGYDPEKAARATRGTAFARSGRTRDFRHAKVDPIARVFMEQDEERERLVFVNQLGIRDASGPGGFRRVPPARGRGFRSRGG